MPLNLPNNVNEVDSRIKTDFQNRLPQANPFLRNSFVGAFLTAIAGRVFESFQRLRYAVSQVFPDTAENEFLERWGSFKGITRNPATKSAGRVAIQGTQNTIIPLGTGFTSAGGIGYQSTESATIGDNIRF